MDLSGIISISGRSGLFVVIAQGKNNIIVESIIDKKRFPAYSTDRISALEDISIYTHDDDKPLKDIFSQIFKKQKGAGVPSHKEDLSTLQDFLSDILPDYDEERVYPSDIKKLFQWYNILHSAGKLKPIEEKAAKKEVSTTAEKKAKSTSDAPAKKPAAKKKPATEVKDTDKPKAKKVVAPKKAAEKKPPVKKSTTK